MTTLREAAEMALTEMANARDYIWLLNEGGIGVSEEEMLEKMAKTITDFRAALASQTVPSDCLDSHQPVAWMDREGDLYKMPEIEGWAPPHTMLYTAPPQREWVDLTNEEIEWIKGSANRAIGYIRVTAAKLKEKNLHIKHIRETHENTN